jgi:hypothetical protein
MQLENGSTRGSATQCSLPSKLEGVDSSRPRRIIGDYLGWRFVVKEYWREFEIFDCVNRIESIPNTWSTTIVRYSFRPV